MSEPSGDVLSARNTLQRLLSALKQIVLGAALGSLYEYDMKMKKAHNLLTMVILFGDGYGLSLLPSYYRLQILPHVINWFNWAERDLLDEKFVTDYFFD